MINSDYLYTSIYESIESFTPVPDSIYYYCHSAEDRSYAVKNIFTPNNQTVRFIELKEFDNETIVDVQDNTKYFLRSSRSILSLLNKYNGKVKYFDVSGMDNRICASLLKNSIESLKDLESEEIRVLYVEPSNYNIKLFKSEGIFNDLSEVIEGISPLPGFAKFYPTPAEETRLVALLGFEGGRFTHILENIQPPDDNIVPIIGVPGFRLEYPHISLAGNSRALLSTDAWRKVKFAAANSFVDAYMVLTKLLNQRPLDTIRLAPLGTKPHAIAAILFAIRHPNNVELIYDNPRRKKRRTEGVGRVTECFVSKLIKEK